MDILQTIAIGLGGLSLIVMVHEYGHYFAARCCGVGVLRFSIGFGTPLCKWTNKEGTEFALAPIPLGGYVQLYGESPGHKTEPHMKDKAFGNKAVWQRSVIVAAGPAINYLLAIMLYWVVFTGVQTVSATIVADIKTDTAASYSELRPGYEIVSVDGVRTAHLGEVNTQLLDRIAESGKIALGYRIPGDTNTYSTQISVQNFLVDNNEVSPIAQLGIVLRPLYIPRIDGLVEGGAAERAGLHAGDILLTANGKRIYTWMNWVSHIRAHAGEAQTIKVLRDGVEIEVDVELDRVESSDGVYGQLGVRSEYSLMDDEVVRHVNYSPWNALGKSMGQVWNLTVLTLDALGKMIVGALSPKELSGPISIVKITGEAAEVSWSYFLSLMALISMSLGLLNLMPIPMLDGGQLMYLAIEGVTRKPLSAKIQLIGQLCGALILGTLMIFVIYNDIARL